MQYNRRHATGYLSLEPIDQTTIRTVDLESLRNKMTAVDMNGRLYVEKGLESFLMACLTGFYEGMGSFAQFGPMYRRIQACHVTRGPNGHVEVLTEVRGADTDIPKCVSTGLVNLRMITDVVSLSFADYRLHPAVLDAAIHVAVHPILTGNYHPELYHLPSRASSVRLLHHRPLPKTVYGYATLVKWTPGE